MPDQQPVFFLFFFLFFFFLQNTFSEKHMVKLTLCMLGKIFQTGHDVQAVCICCDIPHLPLLVFRQIDLGIQSKCGSGQGLHCLLPIQLFLDTALGSEMDLFDLGPV